MTSIVVFAPDLMDRSRFDVLKGVEGVDVKFTSSLDLFGAAAADIGIADLGRPGVLEVLEGAEFARKIGFISHVLDEGKAEAQARGVETFNRSVFFSRVVATLGHS